MIDKRENFLGIVHLPLGGKTPAMTITAKTALLTMCECTKRPIDVTGRRQNLCLQELLFFQLCMATVSMHASCNENLFGRVLTDLSKRTPVYQ